jgi:hypothetical protein
VPQFSLPHRARQFPDLTIRTTTADQEAFHRVLKRCILYLEMCV